MMSLVRYLPAVVVLGGLLAVSSALAAGSANSFVVRSSLDGKRVLPHRIHWVAHPRIPSSEVGAVDFLVDGKKLWVEHRAPYDYGDDGNYLVTSFLKPGKHKFTVKVLAKNGRPASDTVKARVLAAPAPPDALAGAWTGSRQAGGAPEGAWRLEITQEGWEIIDPKNGGNRLDVAYLSPSLLEVRTGMATGHPHRDLNGWCNDKPGRPARYHWSVTGTALSFSFAGGHACPGFTSFITGSWSRAS
jgi:hypothetical protein